MQDPLYREIILEHWEHPLNYGVLKKPNIDMTEVNSTCGDEMRIMAKISKGKLIAISFTSSGCAISKASASLFTESVKNLSLKKIIKMKPESVIEQLTIDLTPARYKCALLCFNTLRHGITTQILL